MSFLWPDPADPDFAGLPWPVVADTRNVHPPVFLLEALKAERAGGCAYTVAVRLTAITPGPDNGDAQQQLWDIAAPALLALPAVETVTAVDVEDLPAVRAEFERTVMR